jgi:hypothetical protein
MFSGSVSVCSLGQNGTMEVNSNPFRIGDKVQFVPNQRAQGWSWFGPGTIQPNDVGIVSRIQDKNSIYITRNGLADSEVGGFHWTCFRKVD